MMIIITTAEVKIVLRISKKLKRFAKLYYRMAKQRLITVMTIFLTIIQVE